MEYIITNGELYHHGIKGQKWGVRRFQNADGSLTSAGQKRYGPSGQQFLDAKTAKKEANKEYSKAFNKAYNKSYQAYSFSKAKRQASEKRWEDAIEKAQKAKEADQNYKEAKKQMKTDRKEAKQAESIARGKKLVDAGQTKSNTIMRSIGMQGMNSFSTNFMSGAMNAAGLKGAAGVIKVAGTIKAWQLTANAVKDYNDIKNYERSKKS